MARAGPARPVAAWSGTAGEAWPHKDRQGQTRRGMAGEARFVEVRR